MLADELLIADKRIDIMVSHDWPAGITEYGDVDELLKKKPFFREDIKKNALGNPATMSLLHVSFRFARIGCDCYLY